MATSGVYSLSVNRDQIIRMAMLIIQKLEESEVPSAQETTDCALILNMLVKQWQGKADFSAGLKTWTRKRGHLFLSYSTGQYTLSSTANGWTNETPASTTTTAAAAAAATAIVVTSATGIAANYKIGIELSTGALQWTTVTSVASTTVNLNAALSASVASGARIFAYQNNAQAPVQIEAVVLRDVDNQDVPVRIITSTQEYDVLPSKADSTDRSDPTAIFYEPNLGYGTLYTDVGASTDVTKHLVITHLEPVQDFVNATDEPCYPQEWYLALSYGLAEQIAPIFAASWTPLMQKNAASALAIAQNKEAENSSLYFQAGEE